MQFKLKSKFKPAGDQPQAIKKLVQGLSQDYKHQTLLGVTGSGKTFTMANIIAEVQKPTLVIAHNKTLAAQLCNEYREFFPKNAVEYFVSYYDYYQPEAYLPVTDTYIEKEAMINEEIDRLRHAATQALLSRKDVIIVASVSCIYGLGAPENYEKQVLYLEKGQTITRSDVINQLIKIMFNRTNSDLKRGYFRARGETIEIKPVNEEAIYRVELREQKIVELIKINPVNKIVMAEPKEIWIYPAKHFITLESERELAMKKIEAELADRLQYFKKTGKLLEAERLERRTKFDLEMIREIGFCHGIENYSRHLSGRLAGEPPETLLSYFPDDFLLIIDESHVTIPQLNGMYEGDAARKRTLIDYGFRLPSAADNRPLKFKEFEKRVKQAIYTSATPGPYEFKNSNNIVEQIIRPTGLIDPELIIKPVSAKMENIPLPPFDKGELKEKIRVNPRSVPRKSASDKTQIEDLIIRIKERIKNKERILVTTLTKKMAEELSDYLGEQGIKVNYLHSDVETLNRIKILTEFRKGTYDVLIGVNLLREGLDLPEVSLVAILDADKEGFLRNETSLIQTIGRAARNVHGQVILYADNMTESLRRAILETERRRKIQIEYNKKHHITPKTIIKTIKDIGIPSREETIDSKKILALDTIGEKGKKIEDIIAKKEKEMKEAAKLLDFELAAILRDEIRELKKTK
jgi:excinuclease ABC subunit B